ncbi:hypothetical protein Tamer19_67090 [Cupriavidus sp. TA19]|uniref:alcohol dehydrogenase catalytic domain-containing protein n=1 Tax=unclassified Cupriavidus TaxID=2640874 RepID=UPI0027294EB1|nr:alcohol dehydrogenase catalytic domain-containing protein [Cupriavidus sp. TA19]GLC97300.1 hypothetical protein Tamer19_67090 [Cupriavidus sp. TA19]
MPRAILLSKPNSRTEAVVSALPETEFPDAENRLRIVYASIAYKDTLAIEWGEPVVRQWPMVPGTEGVGVVDNVNA